MKTSRPKHTKKLMEYKKANPYCEVCKLPKRAYQAHHIRTRGAGGDDDPENLLALCDMHHKEIHYQGNETFMQSNPHMRKKIEAALERSRELDI